MNEELEKTRVQVGQLIRQLRLARGLTLDEVAAQVGCVKGYLSTIERGLRPPPGVELAARLEEALGAPAGVILRAAAWYRTPAALRSELRLWNADDGASLMGSLRRVAGFEGARVARIAADDGGLPSVARGDLVCLGEEEAAEGIEERALVAVGDLENAWVRRRADLSDVSMIEAVVGGGAGLAKVRRVLGIVRAIAAE